MSTVNAGIVTAYGAAVRGGYTGTYDQFCAQQANYAQSAAAVEQAKVAAEDAAVLSESYAVGCTGTRTGEDTDNAKYYMERAATLSNADLVYNVYPTEQAQGNPASFDDGADNIPVKDLKVSIVPHQDLHGYDHPWPAGGGENKLHITSAPSGAHNGITFTLMDESQLHIQGTASADAFIYESVSSIIDGSSFSLQSGTYTMSTNLTNAQGKFRLYKNTNGTLTSLQDTINHEYPFTFTLDAQTDLCINCIINNGTTINNDVWVQIKNGSNATAYEPYSNICPITGMTEVEVERTGKNLLPINQSGGTVEGVTLTVNSDGTVIANGTSTSSNFKNVFYSTSELGGLQKGVSYICTTDNDKMGVGVYAYVGSLSRFENTRNNYVAFTLPSDATGILIRLEFANGVTFNNETIGVMVRLSSDSEEFEPYHTPQTFTADLGRTVYGGTLDVTTGVLTVDMYYAVMSSLTWSKTSGYPEYRCSFSDNNIPVGYFVNNTTVSNIVCSIYKAETPNNTYRGSHTGISTTNTYISVGDASISDIEIFNSVINGQQIAYKIATPQTYQLTPQELLSVLGTNHISTDADSVEVEYRADIKLYIENLTKPEEDDLIANSAIAAGTFFMIGNRLFLSTASIANGATINPGTNCTELSLSEALNVLNS